MNETNYAPLSLLNKFMHYFHEYLRLLFPFPVCSLSVYFCRRNQRNSNLWIIDVERSITSTNPAKFLPSLSPSLTLPTTHRLLIPNSPCMHARHGHYWSKFFFSFSLRLIQTKQKMDVLSFNGDIMCRTTWTSPFTNSLSNIIYRPLSGHFFCL